MLQGGGPFSIYIYAHSTNMIMRLEVTFYANERSLQRCACFICTYGIHIHEPNDPNKYNNHNIIVYTEGVGKKTNLHFVW